MRRLKSKIALLIITILFSFILGEVTIRFLSNTDLDGNIIFQNVQFKPYKLPIKETKKKLQQYSNEEKKSRLLFDRKLGWLPHNNFVSSDSMYLYNREGIRCGSFVDTSAQNDTTRIMIFGDSYAHGDEVVFTETIGYFLEKLFSDNKLNIEVLNLAVSGYGIDQAYLRWEKVKHNFKPDFVIFGVQLENTKRNLNIIRPLYSPITDIPFSKPRFLLGKNKLSLLENPSNSINDIVDILNKFEDWELKNHEGFYYPDNYQSSFIYHSQLISFVSSALSRIIGEYKYYSIGNESFNLTMQIINCFKLSVEKKGTQFIIVHLPVINDFTLANYLFSQIFYHQNLIYENLKNEIKEIADLIEIYPFLEKWIEDNSTSELFMSRHYSPIANELIAKRIYNYLILNHKIF